MLYIYTLVHWYCNSTSDARPMLCPLILDVCWTDSGTPLMLVACWTATGSESIELCGLVLYLGLSVFDTTKKWGLFLWCWFRISWAVSFLLLLVLVTDTDLPSWPLYLISAWAILLVVMAIPVLHPCYCCSLDTILLAVYPFCLAYGFWFLCCLWVLDSGFWVLVWIDVVLPCWTVLLGLCWDFLLLLVDAALFICITLWICLWLYQLLVQPWALCCPSACLVVFCYLLPLSISFHAGRWTVVIIPCLLTRLSLLGT
jgi:hypothetical protein